MLAKLVRLAASLVPKMAARQTRNATRADNRTILTTVLREERFVHFLLHLGQIVEDHQLGLRRQIGENVTFQSPENEWLEKIEEVLLAIYMEREMASRNRTSAPVPSSASMF